jgi:Fic family protein
MRPFKPQKLPLQKVRWEPLIPYIGQANRSLALFEGVLKGVPNPELLLSPLTTEEAVLSSQIEGTQASLSDVLRYEAGETPREESRQQDIHEIINYRRALKSAENELRSRPFSLNLLKKLHSILLDSVRGRDKGRGSFRKVQNWIGPPGTPMAEAYYVPPTPDRLMEYLDNWEKYYHLETPDPLVQLAIVHAQFEIIHPFVDGNGRLGRMLIPLFLHEKKLLSRPIFYLSAYLEANRREYYETLRALGRDDQAWNMWIRFFLNALNHQANANAGKAIAIMNLYENLKQKAIKVTRSQYAVPVLDQLFRQPILPGSTLVGRPGLPSKPVIMSILGKLKKSGMLRTVREGSGRRPQVFALADLVNLCEGKKAI